MPIEVRRLELGAHEAHSGTLTKERICSVGVTRVCEPRCDLPGTSVCDSPRLCYTSGPRQISMPAQGSAREVRFGDYGLDLGSSELRRHGHKAAIARPGCSDPGDAARATGRGGNARPTDRAIVAERNGGRVRSRYQLIDSAA